jgi:hypothetical protein
LSYSVDENILLYASDRASPRHAAALRFLEERPADPDIFCLAWPTLLSYMRIATHPSIFADPLTPAAALDNVEALMSLPRVRAIGESDDFLAAYRQVTSAALARGNLVPDAHLATLLRQHGVRRLYTIDADYRRFRFLEVRDPFA